MNRTERLVVAIAALSSFVAFLDGSVVNVALPAITNDLGGGLAAQQWIVDSYLITLGALILVAGSLSDVFGRIRIMRIGLIGFCVTSLAIGLAPSVEFLVIARALQGVAGALLVPSSLALITSTFSHETQGRAIGTWTALTSVAQIAGPLIGGLFVDAGHWRGIFFINVIPVGIALWLLMRLDQHDTRRPGVRIDVLGAILATLGLAGTVFALIEAPRLGLSHPAVWLPGVLGVLALVGFLWRQKVASAPLMPLDMFRIRNFWTGNVATALIYGALSLNALVLTVYLQEGAGVSATLAGLSMLPITVIIILLSSRIGRLVGRFGPRVFMTVGPILCGVGNLLMLSVGSELNYWTQLLPGIILYGLGLAITVSPLTTAILGSQPVERSGIASAINNAVSRVSGLLLIAMLGLIVGDALDLEGLHRSLLLCGAMLLAGGLVSFLGIRNPRENPAPQPS